MSEFEDRLNHILSSPEEMEKISRLAAQLMGGTEDSGGTQSNPTPDLSRLLGLSGRSGSKAALLSALAPYLQPERRKKLEKALRLAQAARIAGIALDSFGGDGSV